ncbi:hypothetical protein RU639_007617 [Aspergillus parasiticus]
MKLFAILSVFFAGAIMAAPVPDNSIDERGIMAPSAPIEERGIAHGGLLEERGLGLKKPVVERARLTPSVPIEERGQAWVKKPIAEPARLTPSVPVEKRGEPLVKKPIAERRGDTDAHLLNGVYFCLPQGPMFCPML